MENIPIIGDVSELTFQLIIQKHYGESKSQWKKSEYHCPFCGQQTIFTEDTEGDYYIGAPSICVTCDAICYLDNSSSQNEYRKDELEILKKIYKENFQ